MCFRKQDVTVVEFLDDCQDGLLDEVKRIYEEHPNKLLLLQAKDLDLKTCFHFAAYCGHEDVLAFLLDKAKQFKLDIDVQDDNNFTPLLYACFRGYDQDVSEAFESRIACVTSLIEHGANINYQKKRTLMTPLHWAAYNNDAIVLKYLLEKGAQMLYSVDDQSPIDIAGLSDNIQGLAVMLKYIWDNMNLAPNSNNEGLQKDVSTEKLISKVGVAPMTKSDYESMHENSVKLIYEQQKQITTIQQKNILRILYWACYIGKVDIVDQIVKLGYSPFLPTFDTKTPLMAAVEGKQTAVVNMLMNINFISKDPQALQQAKNHHDAKGNNVLHIAYKKVSNDIHKLLIDNNVGVQGSRNQRGLLPAQMSHKRLVDVDIDEEPDYLFVVKKNRAPFLIEQLEELSLKVKEFQSSTNVEQTILIIYFPDSLLDQMAEIQEVNVPLLDHNQAVSFKMYAEDMFEQFQARQKQYLMHKIFEQEIDIDYYKKVGIIVDHFPLHDEYRKQINDSWKKHRWGLFLGFLTGNYFKHMQPLNYIANYYGEKMAFYYAWLAFFTSWLIIPAIPGLVLFIYQMIKIAKRPDEISVDSAWNQLYCVILAIWSTIMVEMWKRKESEISHIWHMRDFKGNDAERAEYKADFVIDPQTKMIKKKSFNNAYVRRIFVELPTVVTSIGAVVGCFIGFRIFSSQHEDDDVSSGGASVINAAIIIVLGTIYRKLASILADWENHRYTEDWENSLVTKNFSFQFVNSYIALFSIAFYDQDFTSMAENLAVIMVAKQIAMNLIEVYLPMIRTKLKQRKLNNKFAKGFPGKPTNKQDIDLQYFAESQLILGMESNVLVMKYSELVLQFGYIVLFAPAFPLAPLFSIFCNLLEMWSNMNQMSFYSKRFQAQGSNGIGSWRGIIESISIISITCNCAIIFFTSQSLDEWMGTSLSKLEKFYLLVMIEHIIIAFKLLLAAMISDVPKWVAREAHEQQENLDEIYKLIDNREQEFIKKGGVPLLDQIKELKQEQYKENNNEEDLQNLIRGSINNLSAKLKQANGGDGNSGINIGGKSMKIKLSDLQGNKAEFNSSKHDKKNKKEHKKELLRQRHQEGEYNENILNEDQDQSSKDYGKHDKRDKHDKQDKHDKEEKHKHEKEEKRRLEKEKEEEHRRQKEEEHRREKENKKHKKDKHSKHSERSDTQKGYSEVQLDRE